MSTEPTIKLLGSVVGGVRKYLKPQLLKKILESLEGKEFEETIALRFEPVSQDQHGFYRAGIIRHACMESEDFGGWSENDLNEYFAEKFLTFTKNKVVRYAGKEEMIELKVTESTRNLSKKRMTEFIDNVLNYLAEKHEIFPLSPDEFMSNKYSSK